MGLRNAVVLGAGVLAGVWLASAQGPVRAQSRVTSIAATTPETLRVWDQSVDAMVRGGDLRLRLSGEDSMVAGRVHERFDQYYKGVKVFGADLARQSEYGTTVSIFGAMYGDIDIDETPALTAEDAAAVVKRDSGVDLGPLKMPQLLVLPENGTYRLVYRARAFSATASTEYFIDARDGTIVKQHSAAERQAAVGTGIGVLGDTKKMSVTSEAGAFRADDPLRPPVLETFDMRENLQRTLAFLNGFVRLGVADLASDTDNTWTDRASVDAHAYAGYVYDYYFKRFNRRGLDNHDIPILSLVHPVPRQATLVSINANIDYYVNAFYEGDGVMLYGEGLPPGLTVDGQSVNYLSGALDIIAHELTHGVTDFTSGLIYENESGALNESFSDMIGTAVEFFYQTPGGGVLKADYLIGEDVFTPGGIRSMANPAQYEQPDHYSRRVLLPNTEDGDNGGVHTNSGIPNHVFYLAIEGGTNRTSGLAVQGVGAANREQIEKVMYRGFTQLMPAAATFSVARAVTIQAARDLYGAGSNAERAITQAWTAVGVN